MSHLQLPSLRVDSEDPRLDTAGKILVNAMLELRERYEREKRPRESHATTRCVVLTWFALTQESQFFVDSSRLSDLGEG